MSSGPEDIPSIAQALITTQISGIEGGPRQKHRIIEGATIFSEHLMSGDLGDLSAEADQNPHFITEFLSRTIENAMAHGLDPKDIPAIEGLIKSPFYEEQRAAKDLSDLVLAHRKDTDSSVRIFSIFNAEELLEQLQNSSLCDLLLEESEVFNLLISPEDRKVIQLKDLDPISISLEARGSDEIGGETYDKGAPKLLPEQWTREIAISIEYARPGIRTIFASQALALVASSKGSMPWLIRYKRYVDKLDGPSNELTSPDEVTQQNILDFIRIANEVYKLRQESLI